MLGVATQKRKDQNHQYVTRYRVDAAITLHSKVYHATDISGSVSFGGPRQVAH